jgi:hypothetical protein
MRPRVYVGGSIWVFLTQDKVAVVDAVDADLVVGIHWQAVWCDGWYARRTAGKRPHRQMVALHVEIAKRMGLDTSGPIDHRDCDSLNNSRSNLREATDTENARNQRRKSTNRSGFKGVNLHSQTGQWHARIATDGGRISLGLFNTAEEAAAAYARAARDLHGKFARIG